MFFEWRPYVSVAQKLANARKHAAKHAKKQGREPAPVTTKLRKLAASFWGLAWCDNLNRYGDYENRLPRGRTYLKNGSVVDMQIEPGIVKAIVAGSEVYDVRIAIDALNSKVWKSLKHDCAQSIHSLLDLLQGKFDQAVMARLSQPKTGLFPEPKEISMECSCPDSARVCKHIAAVIYGVGVRLDTAPELLFKLRKVDHADLVSQALADGNLEQTLAAPSANSLAGSDLGELFGIDLGQAATPPPSAPAPSKKPRTRRAAPPVTRSVSDAVIPPPRKPGNRRAATPEVSEITTATGTEVAPRNVAKRSAAPAVKKKAPAATRKTLAKSR